MLTKRDWVTFVGLAVFALFIRLIFLPQIKVITPDEAFYIGVAASLGEGRPFGGFDPNPFQKTPRTEGRCLGQPLVPLMFSAAGKMAGQHWVLGAQTANILVFLLLLFLFYYAVRRVGDWPEAFFSSFLFCSAPFAIQNSVMAMTHSLYSLWIFICFLFAVRTVKTGKTGDALLVGVAFFAAYITRTEALFFLILMSGITLLGIVFGPLRYLSKPLLICWVTFLLLVLPYLTWVHSVTGIWQLDLDFSNRPERLMRDWSLLLYLKRLVQYSTSIMSGLPLPLWILSVLGMLEFFLRGKESTIYGYLILLAGFFHFFFYSSFGTELRFFSPALMLVLLATGAGITFIEQRIVAARLSVSRISRKIWIGTTALCLIGFSPGYRALALTFAEEPKEIRMMGELIRKEETHPQTFLSWDSRVCFYAGPACGQFIRPKAVKKEMNFDVFLKEKKVDLVLEDTRYMPKEAPVYTAVLKSQPSFLKKMTEVKADHHTVILYRYESEVVKAVE